MRLATSRKAGNSTTTITSLPSRSIHLNYIPGSYRPPLGAGLLLTDISLYWFSGTVDATLRVYKEKRLSPIHFEAGERVEPPLGVAVFPRELPTPPRSWVERCYSVARWSELPRGGHFAAAAEPELFVEDVRALCRSLRKAGVRADRQPL